MNNILIVEDEHLIARLIEMTLTRAGYRCTLAEDGRTAADLIETTNFDMALLDIMLPGLDGYALLECLRSEERRVGKECRIGCRSRWSPYH